MRLDKFLKVSRLIKQRTRAKNLCENQAIAVNDRAAKASHSVCVGDEIKIVDGEREIHARILEIPTGNVSRKKAREIVKIMGDDWLDE